MQNDYTQTLQKAVKDWDKLVEKWKVEQARIKQAPLIKAQKRKLMIWENLFAYGAGCGLILQVYMWVKFALTK